jgi:hypothetical protein
VPHKVVCTHGFLDWALTVDDLLLNYFMLCRELS